MELSKINIELQELIEQAIEIEEFDINKSDFDTRGSNWGNNEFIVTDVKIYDWLDKDDVITELNKLGYQGQKETILAEFNDDRLSNIHYHTLEMEIMYAKEKYEDLVHLSNPREQARAYNVWLQGQSASDDLKFYFVHNIKDFISFKKRKNNSYKDYLKYLKKDNLREWEERDLLESLPLELNLYGKSGGWLSVCKVDVLEGRELDFDLSMLLNVEDNKEFNTLYNEEGGDYFDKRGMVKYLKEFINDFQTDLDNINKIIALIQKDKSYIKSSLIERLNSEIYNFVEESLIVSSNVKIGIKGDKIKTSLGVSVSLKDFKDNFMEIVSVIDVLKEGEEFIMNRQVGNYNVEKAVRIGDDVIIKAGCHKFSLKNIKEVLC